MPYGRQVLGNTGRPTELSADGFPEWKVGGVTIDWPNIAAATADTTLPDDLVIKNGAKGLQFGTVLYKEASGLFLPATSATSLVIGETFILNTSLLQTSQFGIVGYDADHAGVIEGGRVWAARVQASPVANTYPATLGGAAVPTLANVLAAMPRLFPVELT